VLKHLFIHHLHQEKTMKTVIKTQSIFTAAIAAASLFAFGCAAIGGRALAGEAPQFNTAVVTYGDLNLDSDQGVKVLYARLRGAAQNVCSSFEGRDLIQKTHWQACFDKAVASAVVRVNNTRVIALHNQVVNRTAKG
jgi:UrcA family protein